MSVIIKGMKMPTNCMACPLYYYDQDSEHDVTKRCTVLGHAEIHPSYMERIDDCPIIEVPSPHGRLIDADALLESIKEARKKDPEIEDVYIDDYFTVAEWVVSAPTIIEGEGG